MTVRIFARASDIDDSKRFFLLAAMVKLIHWHLTDLLSGKSSAIPFAHPACQVSDYAFDADAREPHNCFINRRRIVSNQHYRRFHTYERAAPGSELPAEGDIERSCDVRIAERGRWAHIKKHVCLA